MLCYDDDNDDYNDDDDDDDDDDVGDDNKCFCVSKGEPIWWCSA